MKKLFSLLTLALLTMSAWGATVTFTAGTTVGSNTAANSADEMSLNGVTISTTKGAFNAAASGQAQYRFAKDSKTTFTSTVGNITKVEITCTASYGSDYGPDKFTGTGYSAQSGSRVGTWTGDAASFELTASGGQVRATEIVITIADAASDELVPPVFNPAGGPFTGSQEVTVSCSTKNASIYLCQVLEDEDGVEYEQYVNQFFPDQNGAVSGTFYVTESGKYGAYSYKGTDMSDYTYVTFTKVLPTCATPTFTPASGATFENDITVRIDCETEGATILYTVNDEINEDVAPIYITLNETATITAVASLDGYNNSEEATATYTKNAPYNVGGTATFVAGVDADPNFEYRQEGDLTIAKDNVTMKFHGSQYNYYTIVDGDTTGVTYTYRIYKGKDIKFTSAAGNIRKIVFDCETSNPITGFNAVDGLNMETATWEGNAREVTFTAGSKQVRCYTITVTLDDQTPSITVADPVFNPGTTGFTGSQVVSISCETAGAQIYYDINDGGYQLYTAPFTVTEDSTVVKAYAELEGVQSAVVTAKYYKRAEVSTLAEANALQDYKDFVFYGNVVVVYQNGGYLYVKDNTAYGLIYGHEVGEFQEGATLDEEWTAQYHLFRKHINEYQYPADLVATDAALVEIVPTEYAEAAIDTTKINERVLVKGLTLTAGNDPKYLYTADGMAIYNQFGIEYPTELEGKTFDVEGMVSYYNNAVQIMPIAITEAQAAGLVGDVNNDNVVNITDVTVLISAVMTENFANINTTNADLNGDTNINITDVTMLINKVMAQ